jgi:hypothetical protein
MKQYVIFRLNDRKEIYVSQHQNPKSTLVEITDELEEANKFDTSREAYEWAKTKNLDYWRVGLR